MQNLKTLVYFNGSLYKEFEGLLELTKTVKIEDKICVLFSKMDFIEYNGTIERFYSYKLDNETTKTRKP